MEPTTATPTSKDQNTPARFLYLAFELSDKQWKLGFTIGMGQKLRRKTIVAGDLAALQREIERARRRFELPEDAGVRSCYEAGRECYWLHRALKRMGVDNRIVDSASIEVNRRKRRAKADRLDVAKLSQMLLRFWLGEQKVWSVVQVPSEQDEDDRHWHREVTTLKQERTRLIARIRALLVTQGYGLGSGLGWIDRLEVDQLRDWKDQPLGSGLRARVRRELDRLHFVNGQLKELEQQRDQMLEQAEDPKMRQIRDLIRLRALGKQTAWTLVMEFGWRRFRNNAQIGSLGGLCPTPWQSGDISRELGISKAGNVWVRGKMIDVAWVWVRWQPDSPLSRWFEQRFAHGGKRQRKTGIVAVARKLLIALVRFMQSGEIPEGAIFQAA